MREGDKVSTAMISKREQNEAYHADTASLSHSMLKVFRDSAALYHGRFISKTIPKPEPSAGMKLGTCVHALLFNEDPSDEFVKGLDCQRRSNADKAAWAEFEAQHAGKIILDVDEYDRAHAIAKAVLANDTCRQLLWSAGPVEEPIYWDKSGKRCKPDKLVHDSAGHPVCIFDGKTCTDPSPAGFQKAMANFDYHCQAAWYQEGVKATCDRVLPFYFFAVGTTPPYDVAIYECSEEALKIGREKNRETVERIKQCQDSGIWLNVWNLDIRTIDLPRWAQFGEYEGE